MEEGSPKKLNFSFKFGWRYALLSKILSEVMSIDSLPLVNRLLMVYRLDLQSTLKTQRDEKESWKTVNQKSMGMLTWVMFQMLDILAREMEI